MHQRARSKRSFYSKLFPEKSGPKYSDFLKNNSPSDEYIEAYDVTIELEYSSSQSSNFMAIEKNTFTVYAIKNSFVVDSIEQTIKESVINSKGQITNKGFPNKTKTMIYDNLDINIDPQVRGMELKKVKRPPIEAYNTLQTTNKFYSPDINKSITLKNKRGIKFNQNLDLTYFI